MTDEIGRAEAPGPAEQAESQPPKRRRYSVPVIVAAVIMFLAICSYVAHGLLLLLDLGVFTNKGPAAVMAGMLTPEGKRMIVGAVYLFFAAVALTVLIGFLLKLRWAWSAAMTWTAISLLVSLVSYFVGDPSYLAMLACVVLLLVLNQATVHREFRIEGR